MSSVMSVLSKAFVMSIAIATVRSAGLFRLNPSAIDLKKVRRAEVVDLFLSELELF